MIKNTTTPKQQNIIKIYNKLTKTQTVYPSYSTVATLAKVSKSTAYQTIQAYKNKNLTAGKI